MVCAQRVYDSVLLAHPATMQNTKRRSAAEAGMDDADRVVSKTYTESVSSHNSTEFGGTPQNKQRKRKQCSIDNCTTLAKTKGLCVRHGGGKRCSSKGCSNSAQKDGKCAKHGGIRVCDVESCPRTAQLKGKCARHGGARQCATEGCELTVFRKGMCRNHGDPSDTTCIEVGCHSYRVANNRCATHRNLANVNALTKSPKNSTKQKISAVQSYESDNALKDPSSVLKMPSVLPSATYPTAIPTALRQQTQVHPAPQVFHPGPMNYPQQGTPWSHQGYPPPMVVSQSIYPAQMVQGMHSSQYKNTGVSGHMGTHPLNHMGPNGTGPLNTMHHPQQYMNHFHPALPYSQQHEPMFSQTTTIQHFPSSTPSMPVMGHSYQGVLSPHTQSREPLPQLHDGNTALFYRELSRPPVKR